VLAWLLCMLVSFISETVLLGFKAGAALTRHRRNPTSG
jgi:hypothetical protein